MSNQESEEVQVSDAEQVWTAVAQLLRAQVSEAVWFSTVQDVGALEGDDSVLRVLAPNGHIRDRILTRYLPLVRDALDEIGASTRQLVVEVQTADVFVEEAPVATADPTRSPVSPGDRGRSSESSPLDLAGLNPRYAFETFVKGASNQFALAASLRVAETPGRSYNPLFIYGAAGLGKTHLLHAIGHYVHHHYQHDSVRYVTTETFLNEYVDGIRTNTIASFKRRYRDIDVLLIDDIQFMEGKEGLQEEFFHTFNSLYEAGRQIVISSDRSPKEIATLEDRLRSRFEWGLITDILPPDLETRIAILRKKVTTDDLTVDPEVLTFIGSRVSSNIRELEGALTRVLAFSSLTGLSLTVDLAEQVLRDVYPGGNDASAVTIDRIQEIVCDRFALTGVELVSQRRSQAVAYPRQVAMYLCRELTDASLPKIGKEFGGRDHTTVMHANAKITRLISEDRSVYNLVQDLTARIKHVR